MPVKIYNIDIGTAVVGVGEMVTIESCRAAVQAAEANVIRRINEALETRDWCPCCGYDGLWPRGPEGEQEWHDFIHSVITAFPDEKKIP